MNNCHPGAGRRAFEPSQPENRYRYAHNGSPFAPFAVNLNTCPCWTTVVPPRSTSLISSVELEAPWQEVNRAIDALLRGEIAGKAVLRVTRKHTFSA